MHTHTTEWLPLESFLEKFSLSPAPFMFMGVTQCSGAEYYLYKHKDTRRYVNLDASGNPYSFRLGGYTRISPDDALKHALS